MNLVLRICETEVRTCRFVGLNVRSIHALLAEE